MQQQQQQQSVRVTKAISVAGRCLEEAGSECRMLLLLLHVRNELEKSKMIN